MKHVYTCEGVMNIYNADVLLHFMCLWRCTLCISCTRYADQSDTQMWMWCTYTIEMCSTRWLVRVYFYYTALKIYSLRSLINDLLDKFLVHIWIWVSIFLKVYRFGNMKIVWVSIREMLYFRRLNFKVRSGNRVKCSIL